MRIKQTKAIVLRRTNYGEADRIINFITPDGKVGAVAKGVRRAKSKLAGGLELLAVCQVGLLEGRGELMMVTSSRIDRFYRNIMVEYERMQLAYEFIKTVNRVTETVAEPAFFNLLRDSLASLDELQVDYLITEIWFRLNLAEHLGQGLNLQRDANGARLQVDKKYNFDFEAMAFVEFDTGIFNSDHIKFLRLTKSNLPVIVQKVKVRDRLVGECLELARKLAS